MSVLADGAIICVVTALLWPLVKATK
ncbi:DUF3927 family protein [Pantoea brenneri]|nr:DUF3927 family protein [Pantoea brenneri]